MNEHECNFGSMVPKMSEKVTIISQQIGNLHKVFYENGFQKDVSNIKKHMIEQEAIRQYKGKVDLWSRKKLLFWGTSGFIIIQIILKIIEIKLNLGG